MRKKGATPDRTVEATVNGVPGSAGPVGCDPFRPSVVEMGETNNSAFDIGGTAVYP